MAGYPGHVNASRQAISRCFEAEVPLIFLNRIAEETSAISVCADSEGGARRVAEVLVEGETVHIGMITGHVGSWMNSMRCGGFRRRLDELGHDLLRHYQDDFSYGSGHADALDLMDRFPRLNVIYACNDAMAFGALDAIRTVRGARVPDDVAVIGFYDVPMAAWGAYHLTTVHQLVTRMIYQTRRILMRPDRGMALSGQVFLHNGRLVQRATTRPVTLRDGE